MWQCPMCGSTDLEQIRSIDGEMFCLDCGSRIEDKMEGIIIVLGSPNTEAGELYSVAKARCALALREYRQRPGWKFLLTGGYGAHFNTTDQPHAAYVKRHLLEHGIPEEDIVEFALSTNTLEDASCAKPIVQKYGVQHVLVVTSDYHAARARYIFEREFSDTGICLAFAAAETEETICEFDLASQKKHEQEALARLRASDSRR